MRIENGIFKKDKTIGILILPLAVFNQVVAGLWSARRNKVGKWMEWRRRFEFNLDLICQRWDPISLLANFPNFPILEFIRCIRRKIPARSIDLFRSNLHRQFFDHGEFKDSYLFCWILHVKADSNRFNITFIIILSFVTCWSFPTVFAVYNNNKVSTHTYILYMLRGHGGLIWTFAWNYHENYSTFFKRN